MKPTFRLSPHRSRSAFSHLASSQHSARHSGFTLIQLMVVVGIIAALGALLLGVFGRNRNAAMRAQCDTRIKAITMALDAFRQENGKFPDALQDLVNKKYLTDARMLRCPNDPRQAGSYDDFYVMRSSRDSDELPVLVCPLCESDGQAGIQAFKGRYTKQFATRPATLVSASGASIERPGKSPIAAKAGMLLRGGDSIRTIAGGSALLSFADGSESEIKANSEITVLQSFIAGHNRAPLYTLIRQKAGDVVYRVHHGSKFDVTTPTATAGALGTAFEIRESSSQNWQLKVIESKVYCSVDDKTAIYTPVNSSAPPVLSNSASGFGEAGGSTAVTQTNDWIELGESETVTVTAPNGTTTTKKQKKSKSNSGNSNSGNGNSNGNSGKGKDK